MANRDTKTAILDASERLFAGRGFEAASLRDISTAAGANLAAVNYHFGSKQGLIRAVLERRVKPLNGERIERLEAIERAHPKGALPLEAVLEALFAPPLRLSRDPKRGGRDFMKLMGRTFAEPDDFVKTLHRELFTEIAGRFYRALRRALPQIPEVELCWRMHFGIGAMAFTLGAPEQLELIIRGKAAAADTETVLRQLVVFVANGLRAPTASRKGAGKSK